MRPTLDDRRDPLALTQYFFHLIYDHQQPEKLLPFLSPDFSWLGDSEAAPCPNREASLAALQRLCGRISYCRSQLGPCFVTRPAPGLFLVSGQAELYYSFSFQEERCLPRRFTALYRQEETGLVCLQLHLSAALPEEGEAQPVGKSRGRSLESLLQNVYNSVPCGLLRMVLRPQGGYELISLNKAAVELMDYDSPEEAEKGWCNGVMDRIIPEDRPRLLAAYLSLEKPGESHTVTYRAQWRDGSIHWMESAAMLVDHTHAGDPVLQRTITDVTARINLQEKLNREQELYRAAMETNTDAMYEYLPEQDLLITHIMRPGDELHRRETPHFSQRLQNEHLVHPDDVQLVLDNICRGRADLFEVRTPEPGSDPVRYSWRRVTGRLVQEDGRPPRVVGTVRAIQGVREKLAANQEDLHRHQSALQAISSVYRSIYYLDFEKDQFYGVRLPEALGRPVAPPRRGSFSRQLQKLVLPFIPVSDRDRADSFFNTRRVQEGLAASENGLISQEFFQQEDGAQPACWLRLSFHLVSSRDGLPLTALLTCRDITADKEQQLARRREEQQAKMALEHACEAAQQASLAKSDFLSKMSHDIRTPMNGILGMAAVARAHLDDPEKLTRCLDKIQSSGDHLLGLLNEVLDMSRQEAVGTSHQEVDFSLTRLLRHVADIVSPGLEKHGHRFTLVHHLQHDAVRGFDVRLRQILINLLSNAIKYTPDGGSISLTVTEKPVADPGMGCYEFVVEDSGIGISKDFLDKLFAPFERAPDPRVTAKQGTGLGMTITRSLVQMMNGTIRVESQPGQGSRFTVTLFMKPGSGSEPAVPAPRAAIPAGSRILLVEDNELNRQIARELLEISQLQVEEAVNGQEAVERFRAAPPHHYGLILMDVRMPVLDGCTATRAIRDLAARGRPDAASIPIVALTANPYADDDLRFRESGMDDLVSKPLELDRLLDVIAHWLNRPAP